MSSPSSSSSAPSPSDAPPMAGGWSRDHDKAFENAIAAAGAAPPDWEAVAAAVPGKTADEVRRHYDALVEDLDSIEAGRVPIPRYASDEAPAGDGKKADSCSAAGAEPPGPSKGISKAEQERRKGIPWTEEEHRSVFAFFALSLFVTFLVSFMGDCDELASI